MITVGIQGLRLRQGVEEVVAGVVPTVVLKHPVSLLAGHRAITPVTKATCMAI